MAEIKSLTENTNERQKLEKVITGEATTRKRSGMAKMSDVFIAEDVRTVKNHVFMDVVVPAIKNVIVDIVTNGIQMMLWGSAVSPSKTPGTRYNYGGSYSSLNMSQRTQKTNYTGYGYEDPIVTSRGDAERILQEMSEIIREYGQASIADLYDLCGITGRPTDMNYGWTEMPGARSVRVPEGYVIQMPRPSCIK